MMIDIVNIMIIIIVIVVIVIVAIVVIISYYKMKYKNNNIFVFKLTGCYTQSLINYVNKFPNIFVVKNCKFICMLYKICDNDYIYRDYLTHYGGNIMFNDTNLQIKGYINWNIKDSEYISSKSWYNEIMKIDYIFPTITITECNNKNIIDCHTFMKKINYIMNEDIYVYNKFFNHRSSISYSNKYNQSYDTLILTYIDTFFSNTKNIIMNKINRLDNCEKNFVFYGPSGTGKSTFIKRLSIVQKAVIYHIDITSFNIDELYNTITNTSNLYYYIFVFEKLHLLFDCNRKNKKYTITNPDPAANASTDINTNSINKQNVETGPISRSHIRETNAGDIDIIDFMKFLSSPLFINNIIAITVIEDYDYIYQKCPNFFNLTNATFAKFDYMDNNNLQKLAMHHFGKNIDLGICINNNIQLNIPMSCIIEKLLDSKLYCDNNDDSINMFKDGILKLIKEYN